jgi:putative oxidoreductase
VPDSTFKEREMGFGLLLIRVVVGTIMAAHGAQKWFGWFGGHGLAGTGGWLGSMGFKPERFHAQAVAAAEFIGGLLMIFGLFTPFAAAAVIGVMIVAVATVHWSNGPFNTEGGYEFNAVLAAAAAALAFTGAGRLSLDNALDTGMRGLLWGFAAIALGGLSAVLTLASRQTTASPDAVAVEESDPTRELVVDLSNGEDEPIVDRDATFDSDVWARR